jgi:hypothetical protein
MDVVDTTVGFHLVLAAAFVALSGWLINKIIDDL